jgi:hypothetical protein
MKQQPLDTGLAYRPVATNARCSMLDAVSAFTRLPRQSSPRLNPSCCGKGSIFQCLIEVSVIAVPGIFSAHCVDHHTRDSHLSSRKFVECTDALVWPAEA